MLCAAVMAIGLVPRTPIGASSVRIHQINTQPGFVAGTFAGVRVDARGVLTLAPDVETVAQVAEPFAFAVAMLPDGWAVGTGGDGRVLKVSRGGVVSVLFDAPESNVFALWAESDGTLFVGTSPSGRVYRVRGGEATPFFDPQETYIWALARGPDGTLWVATGTEGRLYRVDAAGKGAVAYDADEPHLRSLLTQANGDLLIGTAGQGLLLRRFADGTIRTLHDSALSEVVAIAEAPGGAIFAAVLASEASFVDLSAPRPSADSPQGGDAIGEPPSTVAVAAEGEQEPPAAGSRPPGARGPRSELIAISAAGLVEPVWSSQDETVFALAWLGNRLYVGTGGEGRLYSVQGAQGADLASDGLALPPVPPLTVAIEHDFDQRQVVGLAPAGTGGVGGDKGVRGIQKGNASDAARSALPVVLTTNAAALYRLSERSSASGTYTSATLDAGQLARYGVFRWAGETPPGTHVRIRFRTGSSATPDGSWSLWGAPGEGVASGNGWEVPIPAIGNGRFLQWQVEMIGAEGRSPRLFAAEASYRQVNQRPRIERFGVLDPGQILAPTNFNPVDQVYEPASPNKDGIFTTLQPAGATGDARFKQLWKRGQRTLRWRGSDPNGDELRYRLEVRADAGGVGGRGDIGDIGEKGDSGDVVDGDWIPMVDDLSEDHFGFDATMLPDGRYRFRLEASDRHGNSPEEALTAEQECEPVVIDHTPPERRPAVRGKDGWRVDVSDVWNPLREAMVSIDAGEWRPVSAADGLLDGQRETLLLGEISAPARLVLLRLADAALNYETFDLTSEVKR